MRSNNAGKFILCLLKMICLIKKPFMGNYLRGIIYNNVGKFILFLHNDNLSKKEILKKLIK